MQQHRSVVQKQLLSNRWDILLCFQISVHHFPALNTFCIKKFQRCDELQGGMKHRTLCSRLSQRTTPVTPILDPLFSRNFVGLVLGCIDTSDNENSRRINFCSILTIYTSMQLNAAWISWILQTFATIFKVSSNFPSNVRKCLQMFAQFRDFSA